MRTRENIGHWMGLNGFQKAAEVGVQAGVFSRRILDTWGGELLMVDFWGPIPGYEDIANVSQLEHQKLLEQAQQVEKDFQPKARILRGLSVEAAQQVPPHSLDFVYLDADHSYKGVTEDLKAWIGKVRPGGAIGGHDYIDGHIPAGIFGVRSAVKDYFGREPNIITNEPFPTWIIYL